MKCMQTQSILKPHTVYPYVIHIYINIHMCIFGHANWTNGTLFAYSATLNRCEACLDLVYGHY